MNRKIFSLLLVFMAVSLLAISCSGAKTGPQSANTTAPAATQPEIPQVTIPTVDKSKAPVIQFSVTPASIAPGGSATLSWTVTGATSVTIDHGIGTVDLAGTKKVSPTTPTTYKLTAANESGASATKLVSLAVTSSTPAPATPPAKPSK